MAVNFKSEDEVKEFLKNLGVEYRFGCYSEKKPEVCHLLGDYLETIDRDYKKAGRLYKNTCDDYKYAKSCKKFATYALLGKGLKNADHKLAYEYFEKGCNLNEDNSCLHQGLLLITRDPYMKGLEYNVPKGIEKLKKSCESNNANACYYLSGLHISGVKNVKDNDKETPQRNDYILQKDMEIAFKYATKGCELGNMYCCANLSQMYAKGEGVKKDSKLAEKYKEMALEIQKDLQEGKTLTFQQGIS